MCRNLVAVLFYFSIILHDADFHERIIGGTPAKIEDFPYQASLHLRGRHFCGASIISNSFVITAAHCVSNDISLLPLRATVENLSIHVGSIYTKAGGAYRNISRIIVHEKYDNQIVDYDVALLKLKINLVFTESIAPVELPGYKRSLSADSLATVSGWGYTKEQGKLSTRLLKVTVPIVHIRTCSVLYATKGRITLRMLCAGDLDGGYDACQGDSGGPLVYNQVLYGIVSWGYGCARPNNPGVYTNVATVRKWIGKYAGV